MSPKKRDHAQLLWTLVVAIVAAVAALYQLTSPRSSTAQVMMESDRPRTTQEAFQ